MGKKYKIIFVGLLVVAVLVIAALYLRTVNIEVLNPKGSIAEKQRNLIIFASLLSLVVIIPVYALTFTFLFKYREDKKAKYTPDWDHNRTYETIWWGLPILLIVILSVVTWNSTHALDPYKPLDSSVKPLEVQVVALQWQWLFIYPEQNVASLNYLHIPTNRPINFKITADAPMNSLWMPQLGGQVYAMSGMSTQLHLIADKPGVYNGSSANISGEGFAGMRFKVYATQQNEFDEWVAASKTGNEYLSFSTYDELAKPQPNTGVTTYSPVQDSLYNVIVMKYKLKTETTHDMEHSTDSQGEAY